MYLLDREDGKSSTLALPPACTTGNSPVLSYKEPRLAFLCERNSTFLVYSMRTDGTDVHQLTNEEAGPQELAWSADGQRVILTDPRTNQLQEVNATNGQHDALSFSQDASQPAVSRGGGRLAFTRSFQNVNIWGTSVGGGERHRLLVSSTRAQEGGDISPDGKRIAFESDRSGVREIWVSDIDGGNPVQLTHLNNPATGSPRWSPTGQLIAFDSRAGGQPSIYLVDPDGGVPKKLSLNDQGDSIPTWSRDENWKYLSSFDRQDGAIYKTNLKSGEKKLIAKWRGLIGNVKESKDGKWLYFAKGDAESEVRVVSSDGGADQAVAGMPRVVSATDWALAQQGIYFLNRRAKPATIAFFDFATKKTRQVVALDKPPVNWGGLSLSPDGKWLAYSQVDDTPSDIMLVEHFE